MQLHANRIIPHTSSRDKGFNDDSIQNWHPSSKSIDYLDDDPIDMPPYEAAPVTYEDDTCTLASAYLSDNL